ncbi:MAG: leucine-rich repeat protein, partial [Clostridia bacterium]|nr:leucine-rich repeat protein [Clostridia bacterium]
SAMGFDYDDNSDVYDRSKNELTLEDNNYVAYTIAYKEWTDPATDETYVFYCIPIKGTTANAEWFSNFDLGEGDQHNGFTVATLEIYYKLLTKFSNDNATDDDHRKVLLTGHSRGAACANLLAGWLSGDLPSYISEENVTAYTFACPAVSINAKSTYKNIYSFNNPGDLVAMMPLKSWGYKRNGQVIELDTSYSQYDNMQIQFQSTTGDMYEGLRSGDTYDILLTNLLGDDRDIYYDSATLQLTVDIIAWALGGSGDVNFIEIAKKHFGGLPGKLNTLELLLEAAIGITDLASLSIHINTKAGQQDLLAECAYNAYIQSQNMTAEEFSEYLTNPDIRDLISEIKTETGLTVTVSYDFYLISRALDDTAYDAISIAQCIDAARELICDENGNILYKISHAHSQALYTTWINSMYYGYRGWTGNDSSEIQNVTLSENMYSVGQSCFEGCSSVESVVIDNAEQCIGSNAFANCSSLKYLTLPADHRINHDPFSQSSNLSVLIYTKGKTGVISDRTAMNYSGMLEYRLRDRDTTVMLNEGITHIGNHAFRGGPNGNNIRTVIFPESLKSIGEYSFTYCTLLEECDLPDSVSSLGRNCFAYCSSLSSIDIPASLETIQQYCFYECDGITDLYIPENVTTVCDRAFAMCSGLQKLTITYPYVSLESNSFASCTSLTELIWPSECSHTTNAFAGTTGIESIVYTANGNGIMQNRTASNYTSAPEYISRICLTEVTFEEGVKHIGSYTFYNNRESNSLKSVFLPSTLESIGEYTFYSCNELKECTLPDSVNTLGKYCFAYCTSLTSNHIPTSLTTIPQYCFYDCDAITEIYIPANVTLVAERAFNTCSGLQKLTISSPSVSLSDSSFGSCASLNELI